MDGYAMAACKVVHVGCFAQSGPWLSIQFKETGCCMCVATDGPAWS